MEESPKGINKLIWGITTVVVLVLVGLGVLLFNKKSGDKDVGTPPLSPNDTPVSTSEKTNNIVSNTPPPIDNKKFIYRDGTYIAEGDYNSPGGSEKINVTLVIKDDIVKDAVVVSSATSGPQAKNFQGMFIANFKQFVVGKSIDEVNLTKVSGSSLTPKGWNDAVTKIKVEAKV